MSNNKPYCHASSAAGFRQARTASANQLRGLLVEYGITLPQGISHVINGLPAIVGRQTFLVCSVLRFGTEYEQMAAGNSPV